MRTIYLESTVAENNDMQHQFNIRNLLSPQKKSVAVSNCFVDSELNHLSIIRNIVYVDFIEKNFDKVRFVTLNSLPAVRQHLTPKFYIVNAISEGVDNSSLLRLHPDEKLKLDEKDCICLKSTVTLPKTIIE